MDTWSSYSNGRLVQSHQLLYASIDGPLSYIKYLKGLQEKRLDQEQIEKIANLLANPTVAKYFINKQLQEQQDLVEAKAQISCSKEESINKDKSTIEEHKPVISEGKSRSGKVFVRITGTKEQAEGVRDQYLKDGKNPGLINKDKFKPGVFYFYLNKNT